jgi:hypothetical protein
LLYLAAATTQQQRQAQAAGQSGTATGEGGATME